MKEKIQDKRELVVLSCTVKIAIFMTVLESKMYTRYKKKTRREMSSDLSCVLLPTSCLQRIARDSSSI